MQPIKAPAKVTKKESDDISVSEKKGESVNLVSGELSGEACHRQTLGEESAKLTSDGVSKDNEDSLQEFSLVLSDDEEDLCDPQDKVEVTEIRDARPNTRQELPPLPVFPIFSPKSTSPSSRYPPICTVMFFIYFLMYKIMVVCNSGSMCVHPV